MSAQGVYEIKESYYIDHKYMMNIKKVKNATGVGIGRYVIVSK